MLFDTSTMKHLKTDWFSSKTNARIRLFQPGDLQVVYSHIGPFFDAHVQDAANRVSVPLNCPHPWPSALAPVWLACGHDQEEAAMLLGNLYCRYAIQRPEMWWSSPYAALKWKPRLYVVHQHIQDKIFDGLQVRP
jgi:hypothetical protein